jgi:CBS domain-containing protein
MYRGNGEPLELAMEPGAIVPELPYHAPVADRAALRTIMTRELICARADLERSAVIDLMLNHRVGCIPVVDSLRRPIGVITKSDLLEQLEVDRQLTFAHTAEQLMTPVALSLDEHATIAHAAAMMMSEDTHHVLVVNGAGLLVGIVSAKDIVAWVVKHDVLAVRRDASCGPPEWHPLEG